MLANFSNAGCLTLSDEVSLVLSHNGHPDSDWSNKLQPYDLFSSGGRLGHAN